jgi:DNA-binding SARP family transcriptional activator
MRDFRPLADACCQLNSAFVGLAHSGELLVAPDADAPVMIYLLGKFRLVKVGEELPVRGGSKIEALLARLALSRDRGVQRGSLISAIWPGRDSLQAGQSLSSLIYSLRRLLGDGIGGAAPVVRDSGFYRLNLEAGIALDVARFEMLAEEGDRRAKAGDEEGAAEAYRGAISFYRGDLAGDGDLAVVIQRERYRVMYLAILADLADWSFRSADYQPCLDAALRLLEADPCREDAHRLVMRCHVRLGYRAQALRQFRLCEEILRAEFRAVPERLTVALYDQVRLDPAAI